MCIDANFSAPSDTNDGESPLSYGLLINDSDGMLTNKCPQMDIASSTALRDPLPKNTFFPSSRTSRFYADSFSDQILSLADWPNAYDALTPSTRQ
ncbi:hypothetical protein QR680_002826 [Steinernema hermaphroditum]|uniref:Uncharacterized protein n=1 Tax=Steinernema hermaphroditum TaxID=289476 RepID=A0AA39H6D3_9BILA|nr:hypothetical protein QR680_002826 [Steinernema hermaphroditum]